MNYMKVNMPPKVLRLNPGLILHSGMYHQVHTCKGQHGMALQGSTLYILDVPSRRSKAIKVKLRGVSFLLSTAIFCSTISPKTSH